MDDKDFDKTYRKVVRHPNPVVDLYANSYATPEYFLKMLRTIPHDDPATQAIVCLREAAVGERCVEDALGKAEAVSEVQDKDLHILMLLFWARALLDVNVGPSQRLSIMKRAISLAKQATSLLSSSTPPELAAWVSYLQAVIALKRGDIVSYNKFTQQAFSVLSDSPHYEGIVCYHAIALLERGLGTELEFKFGIEIEDYLEVFRNQLAQVSVVRRLFLGAFLNNVLTGETAKALECLKAVKKFSEISTGPFQNKYQAGICLLKLMRAEIELPELENTRNYHWVASTLALLEKDSNKALEHARLFAEQEKTLSEPGIEFESYCTIRAELAAGNSRAARQLLNERSERNTIHYLDNLFWMQVALLEENRSAAARQFAVLIEDVRRYKAQKRLDFEMELVNKAAEFQEFASLVVENLSGAQQSQGGVHRIIYSSPEMAKVCDLVKKFSNKAGPILITGETGTGKELVARALHESGPEHDEPFIAVNCGAIADTLIDSELFGHKRGAFTGADNMHWGLFRQAGRGTLFLDEIGEISPRFQIALLRVLESGEVRPVGDTENYLTSARVIAATNADINEAAAEGRYRQDLLYRLQYLEIHIPPLRKRPLDILPLAQHFFDQGRPFGEKVTMSSSFSEALLSYDWPGNVRELRNSISRMRIFNSDKLIYTKNDLDPKILRLLKNSNSPAKNQELDIRKKQNTVQLNAPELQPPIESSHMVEKDPKLDSYETIDNYLRQGNSPRRRCERLKAIFQRYHELGIGEAAKILNVSRPTASRYLKILGEEGFIKRVEPTASTKTHYYVLVSSE